MRKLVVLTFVTPDGVMQAPEGLEEDISGDFKYGGWTVGYWDDSMGHIMDAQMAEPFNLLLGRKTLRCSQLTGITQKTNLQAKNHSSSQSQDKKQINYPISERTLLHF